MSEIKQAVRVLGAQVTQKYEGVEVFIIIINNNDNNNNNKLQLGCNPVAVVILHYTKYEIGY